MWNTLDKTALKETMYKMGEKLNNNQDQMINEHAGLKGELLALTEKSNQKIMRSQEMLIWDRRKTLRQKWRNHFRRFPKLGFQVP